MNDWNIQSRAHHCQACGEKFSDKQDFHTVLLDEKQGFHRMDLCDPCWKKSENDGRKEGKTFVSYWQGMYESAPPPAPEAIRKESAETLLRHLLERNEPRFGPACFILAAMLERKRIIKAKENFKREGIKYSIYEHPGSGDLFTIPDPDLQLNQLEEVQRDVAQLLEQGVPAPVAPEAVVDVQVGEDIR